MAAKPNSAEISAAGYSGTPLVRKLGVKAGMKVAYLDAPEGFEETIGELPEDVAVTRRLGGNKDVVIVFVTARLELERRLEGLREAIAPDGMGWGAWPLHEHAERDPCAVERDRWKAAVGAGLSVDGRVGAALHIPDAHFETGRT